MKKLKILLFLAVLSILLSLNIYTAYSYFFSSTYIKGLEKGIAIGFNQGKMYENRRLFVYFIENQEDLCYDYCERIAN